MFTKSLLLKLQIFRQKRADLALASEKWRLEDCCNEKVMVEKYENIMLENGKLAQKFIWGYVDFNVLLPRF